MATGLAVSCVLGLAQWLLDLAKPHWDWREGKPLLAFGGDQLVHLALIALTASAWLRNLPTPPANAWPVDHVWIQSASVIVAAYAFAGRGGSAVVTAVLDRLRSQQDPSATNEARVSAPGAGQLIGVLERLILVTLVWHGEWAAVGFVLTAKSVARFKELEKQSFAEYYLVGTLTSFLVACGLGMLLSHFV